MSDAEKLDIIRSKVFSLLYDLTDKEYDAAIRCEFATNEIMDLFSGIDEMVVEKPTMPVKYPNLKF